MLEYITECAYLAAVVPPAAVCGAGIICGFLTCVTFLACRTFRALVDKKDADTIKKLFPVWWPFGKAFMVPALLTTAALHLLTFAVGGCSGWIATGCLLAAIGPYTGIIMNEDISALRGKSDKDLTSDEAVYGFARSFCAAHQLRLFAAATAFVADLALLTNME